jgi:hypothetical protein
MLKEILANLHCGWGGHQLQIIKLSLRYVHFHLEDVVSEKFIWLCMLFFLLKHTGFLYHLLIFLCVLLRL